MLSEYQEQLLSLLEAYALKRRADHAMFEHPTKGRRDKLYLLESNFDNKFSDADAMIQNIFTEHISPWLS